MRLLLVAYHFPPDAEIGAVRPHQFARLLPERGIEPWILTVRPDLHERPNADLEAAGVPADRIVRTAMGPSPATRAFAATTPLLGALRALRGARGGTPPEGPGAPTAGPGPAPRPGWQGWAREWVEFPDRRLGWLSPAVAAGHELLGRERFDAILSTHPPRVAHLIGLRLATRHRLPWIMDMRDPWYRNWNPRARRSPTLEALHERVFLHCATRAAAVVVNTRRMGEHLAAELPALAAKVVCIPNGCEPATKAPTAAEATSAPSQLTIGYFGFLFGNRNPDTFFQGLRLWLDRARPDRTRVKVSFVGGGFEQAEQLVARLGIADVVAFSPAVPRNQVQALIREQYVLLVVANDQPLQVPGKVFEYLANGRRILAATEQAGATADVLASEPGCAVAETAEATADALARFWSEHQAGSPAHLDHGRLLDASSYARRADEMAALVRRVTGRPAQTASAG